MKAIEHASKYTHISDEDKTLILHTCKSLLYHKGEAWVRKGKSTFEITVGGWDGAEKCDLVGLYLLSKLAEIDEIEAGLYRDDGAAFILLPPKKAERVKNKIVKVFKNEGLNIPIDANLKIMNFLDVEVDLNTGTHKPFMKPNNTLLYIDVNSNHPQCVKRNTGPAVQKRLSTLSSSKDIFLQAAPPYQAALDRAGHGHKLQYETHTHKKRRNTNRRRVTWFNPPFSLNVSTNIGAAFLKHLDACFPP